MDVKGMLLGFEYGWYFPGVRFNVTSRKFTIFLFASVVTFKPYLLKMAHRSFIIFCISRSELNITGRLPSVKPVIQDLKPNFA